MKKEQSAKSQINSHLLLPNRSMINRARNEICRLDFVSFIEAVFNLLNPGKRFLINYISGLSHITSSRCVSAELSASSSIYRHDSLKSLISSIAFPTFVLGHDPTKRIVVISYGLELADKFAYDSHRIMGSGLYKDIFPGTRILRNAAPEILTSRGGYRFGTSIDGSITGRGGDLLIIDDPLKQSDGDSYIRREHVNHIYRNTIHSRLDDPENGAIVIVTQRLHSDDLCGTVVKSSNEWTVFSVPLIAMRDELIQIGDGLYHQRRADDLLHPEYFSQRAADEKRAQDEKIFAVQYQQDPLQPPRRAD